MNISPDQAFSALMRRRFVSRFVHRFAVYVLIFAITSTLGCNSSGGSASSSGNSVGSGSNPVAVPTASASPPVQGSIVLNFPARTAGVTRVVVVGFDSEDHVPPASMIRAALGFSQKRPSRHPISVEAGALSPGPPGDLSTLNSARVATESAR